MSSVLDLSDRLSWVEDGDLKPFIMARHACRVKNPGENFNLDWFARAPLFMDPLIMKDVYFADSLLAMETRAFSASDMATPRWVFYDCAIMPGFISGFAHKTETLPDSIRKIIGEKNLIGEWTPISMFIVIPTMVPNEWMAHNLSSINAMIPKEDRLYGLGFLSKAFGLAYANIKICCGVTQWGSPSMRLHSRYGFFEVLTAYTPAHTHATSLTYRLNVDTKEWPRFFSKEKSQEFFNRFEPAGFDVDPKDVNSLKNFQKKIEFKRGPYFLNAFEIREKSLDEPLTVYRPML